MAGGMRGGRYARYARYQRPWPEGGRMRPGPEYDGACRHAATAQGLDEATAALRLCGLDAIAAQTGGFCMVLTVYGADDWWIGVTAADDAPAFFWVCVYTGDDGVPVCVGEGVTMQQMVNLCKAFVAEHGAAGVQSE